MAIISSKIDNVYGNISNKFSEIESEYDDMKNDYTKLKSEYDEIKPLIEKQMEYMTTIVPDIESIMSRKSTLIIDYVYHKLEIEEIERDRLVKKAMIGFGILLATNILSIFMIILLLK